MPIVPNEDATLIVDQGAVNGNGNHAEPEPVDDGRLDDWGEEPQQARRSPSRRTGQPRRRDPTLRAVGKTSAPGRRSST